MPSVVPSVGFELYFARWSQRCTGFDLRNDMRCDSRRFPRFVPKCAQNVPTVYPVEESQVGLDGFRRDRLGAGRDDDDRRRHRLTLPTECVGRHPRLARCINQAEECAISTPLPNRCRGSRAPATRAGVSRETQFRPQWSGARQRSTRRKGHCRPPNISCSCSHVVWPAHLVWPTLL